MLSGPELGAAIGAAIKLKGVSQQDVADAFGVKQPSVSEWIKTGRISKSHIDHLIEYFSGVVGPDHWGLSIEPPAQRPPVGPPTLDQALPVVLAAIEALPAARWVSVRAQLDQVAAHPEMRDDAAAELLELLQAPQTKHRAAA